MSLLKRLMLFACLPLAAHAQSSTGAASPAENSKPFAVSIKVDAGEKLGELKPIWRFFGADEPNYATMKDGRKLLGELGQLRPKQVYFRAHNLLCTGDGTPGLKWGSTGIYTEDANGAPVYDWRVVDHIFDTYLERGVRPYAQIGFMPQALSVHQGPYQHEWRPGMDYNLIGTGWAYPPKDYDKWGELVYQWVKHCVERYGRAEVEQWYWEVWNEANGPAYWHATPQEFYKLHDYAIAAVRRALPTARVGGPDVAGSGGKFMDGFLQHVVHEKNYATGEIGTPTDFLAFHAKGSPKYVDGHVRLGIANHLQAINNGFKKIAAIPELKSKPIVIGESDPDGCAACTASVYPQNNYRNGTLYSSYTAAVFARKWMLAERYGVNLEGALTWSFEFEDQAYFAGFRVLATNGIDLPVMNVFRMFAQLNGEQVRVQSSDEAPLDEMIEFGVMGAPDVTAIATIDANKMAVLVWHYHDDDVPGPDATVDLTLAGLPREVNKAKLTHYRIDAQHSNAFTAWQKMGSPAGPSHEQYQALVAAGQLQTMESTPSELVIAGGMAKLPITLPRQAVSLLVLEWR